MDAAGRIGQHLQTVELLTRRVRLGLEDTACRPARLLPLFYLFRKIFFIHCHNIPLQVRPAGSKLWPSFEVHGAQKMQVKIAQGKIAAGKSSATENPYRALRCNLRRRAVREVYSILRRSVNPRVLLTTVVIGLPFSG
jgi:hypothetical protein